MKSSRLKQQEDNIKYIQKEGFDKTIEALKLISSKTFKAYPKSWSKIEKEDEWLQPLMGIILIGVSAAALVVGPFRMLYELLKNLSDARSFPDFLRNMVETLFKVAPFYLGTSVLGLVAGALLIATTPFTYFITKPLRYLWTGIRDYLDDHAENNNTKEYENSNQPGRTTTQKLQIKNLHATISEMLDDMINDFVNTFKPYPQISGTQNSQQVSSSYSNDQSDVNSSKVLSEASVEWRQPWDGIKTFAKGLFYLILSPLVGLRELYRNLSQSKSLSNALENIAVGLVLAAPLYLFQQLTSMVRGVTQLATTPLTWLLKKPLRHLRTGLRDEGIGYIDIFQVRYSAIFNQDPLLSSRTREQRDQISALTYAIVSAGWSMGNDLITSVMPYSRVTPKDKWSNEREKKDDLMQPKYGISNILKAVTGIAASPFLVLRDLYRNLCTAESFMDAMKSLVLGVTVLPVLRLLTSAAYLVRGVTQLATTPLTWAIKIPFRYALTGVRDFFVERKLVERRPSIVQEVKNIKNAISEVEKNPNKNLDYGLIAQSLGNVAAKYEKAKNNKQATEIDSNDESHLRGLVVTSNTTTPGKDFVTVAKKYIRLFDKSVKIDDESQSNHSNYHAKIL